MLTNGYMLNFSDRTRLIKAIDALGPSADYSILKVEDFRRFNFSFDGETLRMGSGAYEVWAEINLLASDRQAILDEAAEA